MDWNGQLKWPKGTADSGSFMIRVAARAIVAKEAFR